MNFLKYRENPTFIAALVVSAGLGLVASLAESHVNLNYSGTLPPRQKRGDIKTSDFDLIPCGTGQANQPTTSPLQRSVLVAGRPLRVSFLENINHNSKYRLAFSSDRSDSFTNILMDLDNFDIDEDPSTLPSRQDKAGGGYSFTITVPNTPCEECAFQLIQKMYGGANLQSIKYVSCSDVRIIEDDTEVPPPAQSVTIQKL